MFPKYLDNYFIFACFFFVLVCLLLASCANEPQQQTVPDTDDQYVGSVNSDKYHYPLCRWAKKILPKNEVWFRDKDHAAEYGYVACKVCRPPQ